jgi:AcrR family transcriptional regulator
VADEAGVGKGTVYEYFDSKEDLFLCMCEHLYEQFLESQKLALKAVPDPERAVRSLITSTIENAAMWTSLIYLNIDAWSEMDRKGEDDKLRQFMAGIFKRLTDLVSQTIRDGQAQGAFKDFDADLVSHILLATLDGLMFQLLINKNMFDLPAMADTLSGVLFEGLRK